MVLIFGTTIHLTRGNSFKRGIFIKEDGNNYQPAEGDSIKFALKKAYTDTVALIEKDIDTDNPALELEPEDTAGLQYGDYVYTITLNTAAGGKYTFIVGIIRLLGDGDSTE